MTLILLGLSLYSMTLTYPNGLGDPHTTICSPDAYSMQDGQVVLYHYSGNDESEPVRSYNQYELTFNGGQQFSFEIDRESGQDGNDYYYDLTFKVYNESYLTNIYLSNIHWEYGPYSGYLKNVYFLGQNEYYEDNTSGDYTIWHDNGGDLYLDFDICLMDSSFINGNAYQNGYDNGYNDGLNTGYNNGYNSGYNSGVAESNDYSFLGLFGAVADTPVIMIRSLFDFDFFGVNLLSVVLSLFTAVILFYLLRKLL